MAARYVEISAEEFDEFAKTYNFERIQYDRAKEIVYQRLLAQDAARIIIFSSVSVFRDTGRPVGKDAIRIIIQAKIKNEWRVIWKGKRVHRVKNWRNNLGSRIEDALDEVHFESCPKCGCALVRREGQYGVFYSCITWPQTRCTGKASATGM